MKRSALILALALGARFFYLAQLSSNSDLLIPLFDAQGFVARADQWIRGQGLSGEVYAFSLLYHFFLSACFFITNASLAFARGAQVLLGALTCALLASSTSRMFGRRAGIAAGIIAALYGPAIILTTELMPATLEVFWCVAALACVVPRKRESARRWEIVAFALLGGFGFLLGPRFAVAWLLVLLLKSRATGVPTNWRRYAWGAFALPLIAAFLLLNGYFTTDATAKRRAEEFYLGNSGNLCQTLGMRPGPEYAGYQDTLTREADAQGVSVTRYLLQKTRTEIVGHPARFIKGLGAKALHLLSGRELPGALDIRAAGEATPLIRPLFWQVGRFGFPFALLLALAAAGFVRYRKSIRVEYIALICVFALFLILTRVTAPTRLAWAFLLIPLAGAGLTEFSGTRQTKLATGIAALIALLLAILPGPFCVEAAVGQAERLHSIGNYFMQRYEMGRAASYFEQALESDPTDAQAWNGIGICRQFTGNFADAEGAFYRAIELQPDYAFALFNLASVQSALGQKEQATTTLNRGLLLQPRNGQARNDLGRLLLEQGRPSEAIPHFEQARELNPTVLDPRLNLAAAHQAAGNLNAARTELEAAMTFAPLDPRVHVALGFLNLRTGDPNAEVHFLTARNLDPRTPEPLYGIAAVLLKQNQPTQARKAFADARALDKDKSAGRLLTKEELSALQ